MFPSFHRPKRHLDWDKIHVRYQRTNGQNEHGIRPGSTAEYTSVNHIDHSTTGRQKLSEARVVLREARCLPQPFSRTLPLPKNEIFVECNLTWGESLVSICLFCVKSCTFELMTNNFFGNRHPFSPSTATPGPSRRGCVNCRWSGMVHRSCQCISQGRTAVLDISSCLIAAIATSLLSLATAAAAAAASW